MVPGASCPVYAVWTPLCHQLPMRAARRVSAAVAYNAWSAAIAAAARHHGVGCEAAGAAPGLAVSVASLGLRGIRTARTRPMRVNTSIIVRATAKGLPSGSLTATRTEPTRAVPSEDPRLETLRDRPEISP